MVPPDTPGRDRGRSRRLWAQRPGRLVQRPRTGGSAGLARSPRVHRRLLPAGASRSRIARARTGTTGSPGAPSCRPHGSRTFGTGRSTPAIRTTSGPPDPLCGWLPSQKAQPKMRGPTKVCLVTGTETEGTARRPGRGENRPQTAAGQPRDTFRRGRQPRSPKPPSARAFAAPGVGLEPTTYGLTVRRSAN